ncbi:MAG: sigma-70 family RNA polymerase sigma factor [Oscillospiraceae bacterium]|nr:sigma-70 family RNA polymerase sigma factor [Oscillospiraceae bacterium]
MFQHSIIIPMIIGEIKRFLRDSNSVRVSRSIRDIAYRAMQIKEDFINEHGREPKVEEIAKIMELPKSKVIIALEAIVEPVSLYEPVYSDSGDTIFMMDQISDKNSDAGWLEEISLKEALKILSPREKRILAMRFFDGRTQMDVAAQIGISQAQVSRLEKGALQKIKKQL